jgi:hypothetical protein
VRKEFRNNIIKNTIIMSANRSVQAAQRRRAGPPEPAAPGRGPQPSINSSQMFAAGAQQRMGPGSGQVSGRLAGQQAQQSQKQMMEQMKQQQQQPQSGLGGINKMTLAQAITLITLRLGKVETQLFHSLGSGSGSMDQDEDNILIDKSVIQSLISRIDALEKKPSAPGSGAIPLNQDIALLKQQFDTIKPIVVQSKNNGQALKQQVESLKAELVETKELLVALQNLTMDNSNKIMAFNSIYGMEDQEFVEGDALEEEFVEEDIIEPADESDEIVGTNLKELIEHEFNASA